MGLVRRLAGCFRDARDQRLVEHSVATLIGQRVFGIALGYEDLNDHDELRHDPMMAVLAGKLKAWRSDCAPAAGKSTLNRLELSREIANSTKRSATTRRRSRPCSSTCSSRRRQEPPRQIVLDLDATDDPLHGDQEGRFFTAYYDCYCYLPLYVFCGRHFLAAKLRPSNIDGAAGAVEEVARIVGQIRARWPSTRILLRADFGFAREALMAWCEANRVDFVFGLARNHGSSRRSPTNSSRPKRRRPNRQACPPLQGLPLCDAQELVAPAPGDRQGGMDQRRGQSEIYRHHLEPGRDQRPLSL